MTKTIHFLILSILSFSFCFHLEAKTVKILAIGNSFSDDALEHHLYGLVDAGNDTIIIGNLAIAGASLEMHSNNAKADSPVYSYRKIVNGLRTEIGATTLAIGIQDEKWDYISIQQVSQNAGVYDTFIPYMDFILDYIASHSTNPKMSLILHMTWAYAQDTTHPGFVFYEKDQMKMYKAIVGNIKRIAREYKIPIIVPVATAIQNGRASLLSDTFCRDGFHLNESYGRYTASCTWYEVLFKKSVIGNTYMPNDIPPSTIKIAQQAAHKAVLKPYKVSRIK